MFQNNALVMDLQNPEMPTVVIDNIFDAYHYLISNKLVSGRVIDLEHSIIYQYDSKFKLTNKWTLKHENT